MRTLVSVRSPVTPTRWRQGWLVFFEFSAICLFVILAVRAGRRRLMWRLRNRLVVTYIFIGVIPVALIAGMALIAGFLFALRKDTCAGPLRFGGKGSGPSGDIKCSSKQRAREHWQTAGEHR